MCYGWWSDYCFSTVAAAFATDVTRAVLIFPRRFSSLELFFIFAVPTIESVSERAGNDICVRMNDVVVCVSVCGERACMRVCVVVFVLALPNIIALCGLTMTKQRQTKTIHFWHKATKLDFPHSMCACPHSHVYVWCAIALVWCGVLCVCKIESTLLHSTDAFEVQRFQCAEWGRHNSIQAFVIHCSIRKANNNCGGGSFKFTCILLT